MRRALAWILLFAPALGSAEIAYTLAPVPGAGQARIAIVAPKAGPRPEFRIPAWCPGFYFIQRYQEKISDFRATDANGASLGVRRADDQRGWIVENPSEGDVTVSYAVLGDDGGLGFFGVNVRSHTAFVNGPAAFMYVDGRKAEPARLTIKNPSGWEIATSMDPVGDGTFVAGDYDELIDHPIRLGSFERRRFKLQGVPFEVVFSSIDKNYVPDLGLEVRHLVMASEPALRMFGGAPFKRFVYHVHLAVGGFAGGLEHRASTVIAVPNRRPLGILTLATHEFFHVWNAKHIRPRALGPFDYTQPVRTRDLWFVEGVTDYYARLHAYQSGLVDESWLLGAIEREINTYQGGKTRLTATVEEASWKAWEHGGFGIGDLNFYTKGLLIGWLLDAEVRGKTRGAKSLDDVMRLLFRRHRLPNSGFGDDGIRAAVNEVAGTDLGALYDRSVRSAEELPYEIVSQIGLRVLAPNQTFLDLPFRHMRGRVTEADAGSGLRPGDDLLEVGGRPFGPGAFGAAGRSFDVVVRRDGARVAARVAAVERLNGPSWRVVRDPFATTEAVNRLLAWLSRPERRRADEDQDEDKLRPPLPPLLAVRR
jgi:predicted metalloprotease with PDZ domain